MANTELEVELYNSLKLMVEKWTELALRFIAGQIAPEEFIKTYNAEVMKPAAQSLYLVETLGVAPKK